jgi:K+-transporting ATPase c subunit
MRLPTWVAQHLAALRALLVLTVITGIVYPFAILAIAQIPGLRDRANGTLVRVGDTTVGSAIIGQGFVDKDGNALVQYFQTRPSKAGDGWDPTSTAASNLGPENVVDTLPDPSNKDDSGTRQARRGGRIAAVLHARRRRSGPGRVLPERLDRSDHPRSQPQRGVPGHPVHPHVPGCRC